MQSAAAAGAPFEWTATMAAKVPQAPTATVATKMAVVQVLTVAVDSRRHTRHSELRTEQASKAGELLAATARDS